MIFNSFAFAVFFPLVAFLYFVLPLRFRRLLLLVASYCFYMYWNVRYAGVILRITLVDYWAGIGIERACGGMRRILLTCSILCNFGLLFVFKYAGLGWLLPLGISFHTFQAVSYTVDVYRGKARAERSLEVYALYVAFFPQMVAGPIERAGELLPQFHRLPALDWARVRSGLRTALRGLIKKTAVADLAAPVINTVYGHPHDFPGPVLGIATVQIYCDFSGYSDIAVGLARVLGYDLTTNFRQPYGAKSVQEFWQRWHISLSTWFRDYLYIPLGGNRVSAWQWRAIILIVFVASGVWHGNRWNFVVWGALHGMYLVVGAATLPIRTRLFPRMHDVVKVLATNVLIGTAWVFFRAATLRDALYVLSHFFRPGGFGVESLFGAGLPRFETGLLPFAMCGVLCGEYIRRHGWPPWLDRMWRRPVFRWPVYAAGIYSVIFFGIFQHSEFIYFEF